MSGEVLFTEDQIQAAVDRVAEEISRDFRGKDIVLVPVLKGGIVFGADLLRAIERITLSGEGVRSTRLDFMATSQYEDGQEPGNVRIELDLKERVKNDVVIIVDDVGDTLNTTMVLVDHVRKKEPAVVRVAVMVAKPHNHKHDIKLDYVGIDGENVGFLEGYGMDNKRKRRGLSYIGLVE